ncbi:MAG: pyrroline-5-carboxylate reductase dimerization domain-containing protein [Paracoccaceae bacterium]
MKPTIGILGVGQLAEFLIRGASDHYRFVLSPRNPSRSAVLAAEFGATIAPTNQALVDHCDQILVCLPAAQGLRVLQSLHFRTGQSVLSAMAGAAPSDVAKATHPAAAHCTMMPGHANAYGVGPSLLYPPSPVWHAFLQTLGPVHAFTDPDTFTKATTFGALSGATFAFMQHLIGWFEAQGIAPQTARALVAQTLRGNADVLLRDPAPLADIAKGVATPGGITEMLVNSLNETNALHAWASAMDHVLARITAPPPGSAANLRPVTETPDCGR